MSFTGRFRLDRGALFRLKTDKLEKYIRKKKNFIVISVIEQLGIFVNIQQSKYVKTMENTV